MLPGVGIYSPKATMAQRASPVYSLGKRIETKKRKSNSPGPAAYTPTKVSEKRTIAMPLEQLPHQAMKRGNSIGPGQYNTL